MEKFILESAEVIDRIRSKPEMHFRAGVPNEKELLSMLIEDGIDAGVTDFKVNRFDKVWLISFKENWLKDIGVHDYLSKMIPFKTGPAGGIYSGFIAFVFSDGIGYLIENKQISIKGSDSISLTLDNNYVLGIYFELDGRTSDKE